MKQHARQIIRLLDLVAGWMFLVIAAACVVAVVVCIIILAPLTIDFFDGLKDPSRSSGVISKASLPGFILVASVIIGGATSLSYYIGKRDDKYQKELEEKLKQEEEQKEQVPDSTEG